MMLSKNKRSTDNKSFWKGKTILVVSPHPDDEVFGMGGTLAKAKKLGAKIYIVFFSVSDLKFYEKRGLVKAEDRLKEIDKVAKILKWNDHEVIYVDHEKHMKLDKVPRFELVAQLEKKSRLSLDKIQPDIFAIPAASYNQDHEAVFKACFTASRIHAGGLKHSPETVLVYDSPTLSWNPRGEEFHPNFYVDISGYLETKIKCVEAYGSQRRHAHDPCSVSSIRDLAATRGREVGREACEGFVLYRMVV